MRNSDEESGRLLDSNGCPAANPSSESPPQFASEESVPMMLHTATETEVSSYVLSNAILISKRLREARH